MEDKKTLTCSFCGKTSGEGLKIICGPGVFICEDCVDACNMILKDWKEEEKAEHL